MLIIHLGEFGNIGIRGIEAHEETKENNHDTRTISEDEINKEVEEENVGDGEEESENQIEQTQPHLRRSLRPHAKPAYLDDYIHITEYEGKRLLLTMNEKPWSFNEPRELKVWIEACEDELSSI